MIRPFSDVPLTGWFESENEIRGTLDNPYVQGHVHLYDGSYNGKLISDAKADYTLENKTLTLPKLLFKDMVLSFKGLVLCQKML